MAEEKRLCSKCIWKGEIYHDAGKMNDYCTLINRMSDAEIREKVLDEFASSGKDIHPERPFLTVSCLTTNPNDDCPNFNTEKPTHYWQSDKVVWYKPSTWFGSGKWLKK